MFYPDTNNDEPIKEVKEFSIIEISKKVKELLEFNFSHIRVQGEISGLKIATSGHCYFNLKEDSSILSCVCWRYVPIDFKLEDGIKIIAIGKITSFAGHSKYQLSVTALKPYGVGMMMQVLKERKARLQKEGLFNQSCKKQLPFFPKKIGVVTSIAGAVIKDIIHRISDRFPTTILIWPVSVQGEKAATEISAAIEGLNVLDKADRPDVIIVARGGGSVEDLWAFNEEIIVRAVYNCQIPLISAVGHETDYTLIDYVSDVRAPTPTAAAEIVSPVLGNLRYTLDIHYNRIFSNIGQSLQYNQQKIDELGFRLIDSMTALLRSKKLVLNYFDAARFNPRNVVARKYLQLSPYSKDLIKAINSLFDRYGNKINLIKASLATIDCDNTLKRGFAIIKSSTGTLVTSKNIAISEKDLVIKFKDGEIKVVNFTSA